MSDYRALVGDLASQILAGAGGAGTSGDSGSVVYFDLNQALAEAPGFASLAPADRSFIEAAKRTYDLHRALGGSPVNQLGMVERRDGRFYVGLDGAGGRWLATPAEALSHLANQLANPTLYRLPGAASSALSCPFHFECLLVGAYTGNVPTIAYVPRATTVAFELTADGLAPGGQAPVLVAPPEFAVLEVTVRGSDRVEALVSIGGVARLGVNLLHAFPAGRAFRPLASYGVHVAASADEMRALALGGPAGGSGASPPALAGSGAATPLADDHGNDAAGATLLGAGVSARLEAAGDVDVFRIVVAQPGTLAVASSGTTDVAAVLESADGTPMAADDDGGAWYNFRIEHAVGAGTYFLKVSHCCKGSGPYALTVGLNP
jgi:hypothetical protein